MFGVVPADSGHHGPEQIPQKSTFGRQRSAAPRANWGLTTSDTHRPHDFGATAMCGIVSQANTHYDNLELVKHIDRARELNATLKKQRDPLAREKAKDICKEG